MPDEVKTPPPEIGVGADMLAHFPNLLKAGPDAQPLYPVFDPPEAAPKFNITFQFQGTRAQIGRAMVDVEHELTIRGYYIPTRRIRYVSQPQIVNPDGSDSDQHQAEIDLWFRAAADPVEIEYVMHYIGFISAARQWVGEQSGPKIIH